MSRVFGQRYAGGSSAGCLFPPVAARPLVVAVAFGFLAAVAAWVLGFVGFTARAGAALGG